jgi:tellurite resistance protein
MFDKFFHRTPAEPELAPRPAPVVADPAGDTATVRRIVAKLEAMPPDQARLLASAAYTLARAANADLDISDEETAAIERELQVNDALDEATAILVTEMAKLQAKTMGGTEDFVVTREFKALATDEQKLQVLRACFAIGAANGTISAEETAVVNEIAEELDIDDATLNAIRADYHEQLSSVQAIRRISGG